MKQLALLVALGATALLLLADQSPADKRKAVGDTEASDAWVYDDIAAGIALATKESKPLCIVFR